jgi:hypothetical protein
VRGGRVTTTHLNSDDCIFRVLSHPGTPLKQGLPRARKALSILRTSKIKPQGCRRSIIAVRFMQSVREDRLRPSSLPWIASRRR